MSNLRTFISARRSEIKKQLAELRAELRELDLAEAALSGKHSVVPVTARSVEESKSFGSTGSTPKTLKEMAVEVLRGRPEGADSQQILTLIHQQFGVDVPRSSLSPQLSRLGHAKVLVRQGYNWKLYEYANSDSDAPKENEPLDVSSSGSETGSSDGYQPSKELSPQSSQQDVFE